MPRMVGPDNVSRDMQTAMLLAPDLIEQLSHDTHTAVVGILQRADIEQDTAIWADLSEEQRDAYRALVMALVRAVISHHFARAPWA